MLIREAAATLRVVPIHKTIGGQSLYVREPTAYDHDWANKIQEERQSEGTLFPRLVAVALLCDEEGNRLLPEGTEPDELLDWPVSLLNEIVKAYAIASGQDDHPGNSETAQ